MYPDFCPDCENHIDSCECQCDESERGRVFERDPFDGMTVFDICDDSGEV